MCWNFKKPKKERKNTWSRESILHIMGCVAKQIPEYLLPSSIVNQSKHVNLHLELNKDKDFCFWALTLSSDSQFQLSAPIRSFDSGIRLCEFKNYYQFFATQLWLSAPNQSSDSQLGLSALTLCSDSQLWLSNLAPKILEAWNYQF